MLNLQDNSTNQSVPLEICPAYDNIANINTENCEAYIANINTGNCEAYGARDTHTEQQTLHVYTRVYTRESVQKVNTENSRWI